MASLNHITIIGYLGKDPELRNGQSGQFCNLNVSTDESYVDRNGAKVKQTEWHSVVVNGKQAEPCGKWLHKGSLVCVEGKIRTRKYQDQSGQERYKTEIRADRIQFLDRKESDNQYAQAHQYNNPAPSEVTQMDEPPF